MPRYRITFYGRTIGAIGVDYVITAEREGDTPDAARMALYDKYEHVLVVRCTPVPHTEDTTGGGGL